MCNQTVSLVAAKLERQGISTVTLILLLEVAQAVRPPRALFVPFPHGFPQERHGDPPRQLAVLEAALQVLEDVTARPPVLAEYTPSAAPA